MKSYRYVFGPVPSRRLGFSLGVDIIPPKTCTFDCVYCQVGRTTKKTPRRGCYAPPEEVIRELAGALRSSGWIDFITFSGSGEPTLNRDIGKMIRAVKKISDIPVAVLTNGTLLGDPQVRADLAAADLVVPSLDAGSEAVFRKLNRPARGLTLSRVVRGMAEFTRRFDGRVWLEVMLVKGINDSVAELGRIARRIAEIRPDKVQLNTVARPPSEPFARALSGREMEKSRKTVQGHLGRIPVEVVGKFGRRRRRRSPKPVGEAIVAYLRRRPATVADLAGTLGRSPLEIKKYLARLEESGQIRSSRRLGKTYYRVDRLR